MGAEDRHLTGNSKKHKLSELDVETDYEKTFYKERWINADGIEQHLIVTFSLKYKKYQEAIREKLVEWPKKLVLKPSYLIKKRANDPKRFIVQDYCTNDG